MRSAIIFSIVLIMFVPITVLPDDAKSDGAFRIVVELADDTLLVGTPTGKEVGFNTPYGSFQVPWTNVISISQAKDERGHRFHRLETVEGTSMSGNVEGKTIRLITDLGEISFDIGNLEHLQTDIIPIRTNMIRTKLGQPEKNDMILYYPFARSTKMALDHSQYENDGILHGGAWNSSGSLKGIGGAYSLQPGDAISVVLGDAAPLGANHAATFALWWNIAEDSPPISCIFSKRDRDENWKGLCFAIDREQSSYYLWLKVGHWAKYKMNYRPGQWHHVVLIKDKTKWSVLHDGQALQIHNSMGWPVGEAISKPVPLLIGKDSLVGSFEFKGSIDEVYVFDRALGPNEVLKQHNPRSEVREKEQHGWPGKGEHQPGSDPDKPGGSG